MKPKVQIILPSTSAAGRQGVPRRMGLWRRVKLLIVGIGIAAGVTALVLVAIVLGSILAVLILITMAVAMIVFVVRAGVKRRRE